MSYCLTDDKAGGSVDKDKTIYHPEKAADLSIELLAKWLNPMINGWIGYYGLFTRSALYGMCRHVNKILLIWARREFKTRRRHKVKVIKFLEGIFKQNPRLFAHWREGMTGAFA